MVKMRPVYFFNPSYDERNINFQNLGLVSIASHLKRRGIPAYVYMNYLDERVTKEKDYDLVLDDVLAKDPQYIGVSCMTTQYMKALDLTRRIKEKSNVPVVWGGHHVKAYFNDVLQNRDVWCAVPGWGEQDAESLYKDKWWEVSKEDPFNYPLDFSTVINYQPVERMMRGRMVRQASIMGSYGCPYSCKFCINAVHDKQMIYRDLGS